MSWYDVPPRASEWVTGDRALVKKQLGAIGADSRGTLWFQSDATGDIVKTASYEVVRPPLVSGMRVRWGGERDKTTKKFLEGVVTIVNKVTVVRWDGKDDFTQPLTPDQVATLVPFGVFDTAKVDELVQAADARIAKENAEKAAALKKELLDQAAADLAARQKKPPLPLLLANGFSTDSVLQEIQYLASTQAEQATWLELNRACFELRSLPDATRSFPIPNDLVVRVQQLLSYFPVAGVDRLRLAVESLTTPLSAEQKRIRSLVHESAGRSTDDVLQEIQSISSRLYGTVPTATSTAVADARTSAERPLWMELNQASFNLRRLGGYNIDTCKTFPTPKDPTAHIQELLQFFPVTGVDRLREAVAALPRAPETQKALPNSSVLALKEIECLSYRMGDESRWLELNRAAREALGPHPIASGYPVTPDPLARVQELLVFLPASGLDRLRVAVAALTPRPLDDVLQEIWDVAYQYMNRRGSHDKTCQKIVLLVSNLRTLKGSPRDFPLPADPPARLTELLALVPNPPAELREAIAALAFSGTDDAVLQEMHDIAQWLQDEHLVSAITKARGGFVSTLTSPPADPVARLVELLALVPAQVPYRWAIQEAVERLNNRVPAPVSGETMSQVKRLATEPSPEKIDSILKDMLAIAWVTPHSKQVFDALQDLRPGAFAKNWASVPPDPAGLLTQLVAELPDHAPYGFLHGTVRAFANNPTPETTPMPEEKPSLVSRIKLNGTAVAKDAGWRILAAQIVRTASQSVAAGVRAKLKNSRAVQRQINRVLESPYGEAGIGVILSIGTLAFMPVSAKRDRLSHEFAVGAATLLGNDTINTFLDPFRTFITDVVPAMMASLPEPEPMLAEAGTQVAEKVHTGRETT